MNCWEYISNDRADFVRLSSDCTVLIRKRPQVIPGGGVRTPCTLPLDPPLYRERFFRLGRRQLGQNAIQYDVTESQRKAQTQSIVHLTQRRHVTWHPYQRHVFCKTTGQLICLSAMYSCASLNWNGRHFVRSASLSRSSCYKSAKILEKFWYNKILAKTGTIIS